MTTILWDDEKSKVEATYVQTSCDTVLINFLIKTRNFSGRHTFFIPSTEIKKHVDSLNGIHKDLDGNLDVRDSESDSFIILDKAGDKWFLTGQLGRSWEHNIMIFRISVDQTVIQLLLDFLRNIVTDRVE